MARFYGSLSGPGKDVTKAGDKTGQSAHIRGWEAGVRVFAQPDEAQDKFEIYMTGGSNGNGSTLLGTVRSTPEGPVFVPADRAGD